MNSLVLISPARAWGFKPILSGKLPTQTQSVISEFLISNFKFQISNFKFQMVLICGVGLLCLPLYSDPKSFVNFF